MVRLHHTERGAGEPLLLLHGWPQHGAMWDRVAPTLAERWRLVVPDLRGLGRSPAGADYTKRALLADVVALLERLGIERCQVMGHDWGGWIAWLLAAERADLVERAVTLDIPPPWRGSLSPRRLAGALGFSTYQWFLASPFLGERALRSSPGFVRAFIRGGAARKDAWSEAELDVYAEVLREPERARASRLLYRHFLLRELPAVVRGTYTQARAPAVPTLALFGERSPIVRALGLPDPARNVTIETIPGAGHFIAEEAPDEVLELAVPFLEG